MGARGRSARYSSSNQRTISGFTGPSVAQGLASQKKRPRACETAQKRCKFRLSVESSNLVEKGDSDKAYIGRV